MIENSLGNGRRTAVVLASIKPGVCDLGPGFGTLDLADINRFISGTMIHDPAADMAPPYGTFDLQDVNAFLGCFLDGCR